MRLQKCKYIMVLLLTAILIFNFGIAAQAAPATKTVTVDFPESTSQSPSSRSVNIPNLKSVVKVTVNTGNVSHSVSGDWVTVSPSGGSYTRYTSYTDPYYYSKTATDYMTSGSNSFPSTMSYSDGSGYSGTLSKSGGGYVISGDAGGSRTEYSTLTGRFSDLWYYINGVQTGDNMASNLPPGTLNYNSGGYSGTLSQTGFTIGTAYYHGSAPPGYTGWYNQTDFDYTATYSGTVTKPDTRIWRQDYSGTVYKSGTSYTYYYAYTVTIEYIDNTDPSIQVTSPADDFRISENPGYKTVTITGQAMDTDNGDIVKIYFKVDNGDKLELASHTATGSWHGFSQIVDLSTQTDGVHKLYIWAEDDKGGKSSEISRDFMVDKSRPAVNTPILTTESETAIKIKAGASDPSGLAPAPYLYNRNDVDITGWVESDTYTDAGLSPNTQYSYKYKAKDSLDNISEYSGVAKKYTKALYPTKVQLTGAAPDTLSFAIFNNPGNGTAPGTKIVLKEKGTGTVKGTADWGKDETKIISGLGTGIEYDVYLDVRNEDNLENGEIKLSGASATLLIDSNGNPVDEVVTDKPPTIALTAEIGGNIYSAVSPYNQISINANIKDEDQGDTITVKYTLKCGGGEIAGHVNKNLGSPVVANGDTQVFASAITVDGTIPEGEIEIALWAQDDRGGKSGLITKSFTVDKTGTTVTFAPDSCGWVKSQSVTVNAVSKTGVSDLKYKLTLSDSPPPYSLDDQWTNIAPGAAISLEGITGKYKLHVYAKDNRGNVTFTPSGVYMLDNEPAAVTFIPEEINWTVDELAVRVNSADEHSGYKRLRYQWSLSADKPTNWSVWTNSDELDAAKNEEGEWYLHVEAEDNLGNVAWFYSGPYRHFKVQAVTNFRITGSSVNSIKVTWDKAGNQVYKLWLVPEEGGEIGNTGWIDGGSYEITGSNLIGNKRYVPYITTTRSDIGDKSYSTPPVAAGNNEKAYTNGIGITRAIFVPGADFIEVTLSTESANNTADTEYEIKNDITGQVVSVTHTNPVWKNEGLAKESYYTYSARVVNKNGEPSYHARLVFDSGDAHTLIETIEIGDDIIGVPDVDDGDIINLDDFVNWDESTPVPFDPRNMPGKTIKLGGQLVCLSRNQYEIVKNTDPIDAIYYCYSEKGFGYSDWKELDNGIFEETVYFNQPGYYNLHFKFKKYNTESAPVIKRYLTDWIKPDIAAESKIKGQTASTNNRYDIRVNAEDNITSNLLFYSIDRGENWYPLKNSPADITFSNLASNPSSVQNTLTLWVSDICGNVTEKTFSVWGIDD